MLAALAASLSWTSVASADVWSVAPRVGDHTGMFLRMAAGFAAPRLSSSTGVDANVGGPGVLWDIAVGWSVAPSMALHVGYFGTRPIVPKLQLGNAQARSSDEAEALLSGLAFGATFHLPLNIYVSPSLGVALVVGTDTHGSAPQRDVFDPGLAAALDIGWEFWVSPQWALGVAIKTSYYFVRDDDAASERTWHGIAGGPLFTATFN